MNRWALLRAVLWLLSGVFLAAAVGHSRRTPPPDVRRNGAHPIVPSPAQRFITADSLSALADRITSADAFRIARRPSPVPFGADLDVGAASAPKPPKPALVLSGIIGGPPWIGVVDGIPGHDQSVLVHPGDSVGGLRIRSVTRNYVMIAGIDTTWRLTVHQPWQ